MPNPPRFTLPPALFARVEALRAAAQWDELLTAARNEAESGSDLAQKIEGYERIAAPNLPKGRDMRVAPDPAAGVTSLVATVTIDPGARLLQSPIELWPQGKLTIEKHLLDNRMVDIFRHLHPNEAAYTWFNRLAKQKTLDAARVDYVLVSEEMIPKVQDAGILADPKDRPGSDHAPIYVLTE